MGDEPDYMKSGVRHILFPSILAGLTIFAIATIWNIREYGIIFACFGSSAFLVYVNPNQNRPPSITSLALTP